MLKAVETSRAIAETVARCRPEVIAAYPITPQTHVVERLAELAAKGDLGSCAFLDVESELGAMSVMIGASATGARAYTATSSQGALWMAEAVYNAAGLNLPIVMTLGTRAIGAPINIWNDHSDAMALRDAGWIQLFASSAQDAADLHVVAFRLAEVLSVPVMVCVDGFLLTHAFESIDVPDPGAVDAFLPPFAPTTVLDPARPCTIGALVGPEAFTEVKVIAHQKRLDALTLVPTLSDRFRRAFGRDAGGLVRPYRTEGAHTVVVALGSVNGTIADLVDELRAEGEAVGAVDIGTYRPFPAAALADATRDAVRVVVVDKGFAPGSGGLLAADVRLAVKGRVHTVIAGLGGRPIPRASLGSAVRAVLEERAEDPMFLDVDRDVVAHERRTS